MRRLIIILLFVAAAAHGATRRRAVQPPQGIPPSYADLYSLLSAQLDAAEAKVAPLHPELGKQPVYAAELLPANANRGPALLQPGTMDGVRAFLDRFQQLGINGVVFNVPYPVLVDRFPSSADYLQFFKQAVAESRKRGMTVQIESSVLFANSPFSPVSWDYSTTPFSQFTQERHDMTAKIVAQLAPDYLDLGAEPDTEAKLTGYTQLNVPSLWSQYIAAVIRGIDRGSVRLGAGLGTWNSVAFVEAESLLPLDFVSLHIYPIDATSIATAFQAADIIRGRGKQIVIDEAWLFKMRPGESTSIAADTTVFARDSLSFFAPLDQRYLRFLDAFARAKGVVLISPFWSTFFFAYQRWAPGFEALSYDQVVAQVNSIAAANVVKGQYSATGYYYSRLINP
ncbi:MAG TPA: hypothetical protein VLV78_07330 [Thermoanaerobaculia bacterium]|nr:hypothetical protein [Thermoanaerobaculia bacterium]